ncbi:MAG TPA: hypothetical protein VED40_09425 [Azospirillaceae bacterium]|nr:hypothetical protein [Azospirillaceae bacterium]
MSIVIAPGGHADPLDKNPAIDHATADLTSLSPLQLTFVPEFRKASAISGLVQKIDRIFASTPEQEARCRKLLSNIEAGTSIEYIEPVLTTNRVQELISSPLGKACGTDGKLPDNLHTAAFGIRLYEVPARHGGYVYIVRHGPSLGGPDAAAMDEEGLESAARRPGGGTTLVSPSNCRTAGASIFGGQLFELLSEPKACDGRQDRSCGEVTFVRSGEAAYGITFVIKNILFNNPGRFEIIEYVDDEDRAIHNVCSGILN